MSHPIQLTDDNFDTEVLQSDIPVIVDFWAPWCGPCKAIAPVLDEVARTRTDVKIAKLNVDDHPALAGKYNIRGIPTLIGVSGGEVATMQVGFAGADKLNRWVDEVADAGK